MRNPIFMSPSAASAALSDAYPGIFQLSLKTLGKWVSSSSYTEPSFFVHCLRAYVATELAVIALLQDAPDLLRFFVFFVSQIQCLIWWYFRRADMVLDFWCDRRRMYINRLGLVCSYCDHHPLISSTLCPQNH